MQRNARIEWKGNFASGLGRVTTQSGGLADARFTADGRFANGTGTNPEELLAAAHGACFSMALTNELGAVGIIPQEIRTDATVQLDQCSGVFAISSVHLRVRARVSAGQEGAAKRAAKIAKETCPISRLVKASITMDFEVEHELTYA